MSGGSSAYRSCHCGLGSVARSILTIESAASPMLEDRQAPTPAEIAAPKTGPSSMFSSSNTRLIALEMGSFPKKASELHRPIF